MFSRQKRKETSHSPEERDTKMPRLAKNERSSGKLFLKALRDIIPGKNSDKKSKSSSASSDNSSVLTDDTHDFEVSVDSPGIPPPVAFSSLHKVRLNDDKEDSPFRETNILTKKSHSIRSLHPLFSRRSTTLSEAPEEFSHKSNFTITEPQPIQPPKPFSHNFGTISTEAESSQFSQERLDSSYESLYVTALTHISSSSNYTSAPSNFSTSSSEYIPPPSYTSRESSFWNSSTSNHTYIPATVHTITSSPSDFNDESDTDSSESDESDVSADDSFEISAHASNSNSSMNHDTQIYQRCRSENNNQFNILPNLKGSTSEKNINLDTSDNSNCSKSSFIRYDKKHFNYSSSNESYNNRNISSPSSNKDNSFDFERRGSFRTPEKRSFISSDDEKNSIKKHRSSSTSRLSFSRSFCTSTPTTQGTILPYYNVNELTTTRFGTGFIDTHCHLDFLFERTNHLQSFSEYKEKVKEYFPISFEGCVAVFCNPNTFTQKTYWETIIKENGIWAAFGCHPHNASEYNHKFDLALRKALSHDKIVALGEIGLDYSTRNNCDQETQFEVFERQIDIALDRKLPLVIHCREAHEDCLRIMKESVPSNYKIHLHCFTDTWTIAEQWLEAFPNLYIGLTNLVTYSSAESVHEVARNIPLERLLLETDTPYFLPKYLPRSLRWSHPGLAIHVAAQVAALKGNVNIENVLRIVRKNTRSMYGI